MQDPVHSLMGINKMCCECDLQDVLFPEEHWEFDCLRIPINDTEDDDIGVHFQTAHSFIEAAKEKGKIFIHCHEGRSRSVTLIISHLIIGGTWTLKDALVRE